MSCAIQPQNCVCKAELLRIREICAAGLAPGSQPGEANGHAAAIRSGAYKWPLKLPDGGVRDLKSGGPGIKIFIWNAYDEKIRLQVVI